MLIFRSLSAKTILDWEQQGDEGTRIKFFSQIVALRVKPPYDCTVSRPMHRQVRMLPDRRQSQGHCGNDLFNSDTVQRLSVGDARSVRF